MASTGNRTDPLCIRSDKFGKMADTRDPKNLDHLLDYLKSWLTGHIMVIDKKYANFVQTL